ncbi:hypothetical protein H2204_006779 [Knufia peltigerae]|uniref:Large ribosomal subunit protein mL67 n=1 Tax=Knufia peltigerae TaxID=1002370 RepID=A0AA39CXE3_9EURO|nr:hypothetical protein H2204_006779 [Knufia peltigerae]
MASTVATTVAHQMPPMPLPAMPRIRPPRMLKGTKSPNTDPQPPGAAPKGKWWVQGKWRNKGSNAGKHVEQTQALQIAKALRHETHGLDIYAYRHVRTNQVVYSLTRTLQEGKILKQLVFHGKKTVPASVRIDTWTPYFSIHFPPTPAGALSGLFAFQKLRELSLQRQLSPPDDLIRVTEEDIQIIKSKIGSPLELQELQAHDRLNAQIPKVGEILPKKLRGRRLMDQKATSVADAAFVLDWISSGPGPLERLTEVAVNRLARHHDRTRRARRRINRIRENEGAQQKKIRDRITLALEQRGQGDKSHLPIPWKVLLQMSMENHGLIDGNGLTDVENVMELRSAIQDWQAYCELDPKDIDMDLWAKRQLIGREAERKAINEWFEVNDSPMTEGGSVWKDVAAARDSALAEFDEKEGASLKANLAGKEKPAWAENKTVEMFWADLNDGLFASSWPENVVHGRLAPFGVAKGRVHGRPSVLSSSVHVIGSNVDDGWMPNELGEPYAPAKRLVESAEGSDLQGDETDVPGARTHGSAFREVEEESLGFFGRLRGMLGGRRQRIAE